MMKYWISVLFLGHIVKGLDVEVLNTTCDKSLPVTADFHLRCSQGSKCTFGQNSTVYGTVYYNGVANSGVQNDVAFVTADLSLWTVAFNLYDMMKVPLCDASLVSNANNQYTCPGTGAYNYEFSYKLPDAGSQATSWMASGWQSSGTVQLYAAQDKTMKIGDCTMALKTYVTQSSQKSSLLSTPSAAATAGIVLASLVVLGLLFLYCYCCCARKRKQNSKIATTENASHFKQLEDEKTYWSGAGSKLSKKTITTKKSGGTGEGSQSVVSELLP